MSNAEKAANDTPKFVLSQVRDVVLGSGLETYMLTLSVWEVQSGRPEDQTAHTSYGHKDEGDALSA